MLNYNVIESDNNVKISLDGEVDMYNANVFSTIYTPVDSRKIIIDCSKLEYIDSTGLGAFVNVLKKAKNFGGSVKITGLKPQIYKLFKLTELNSIFEIEV